MQLIVFSGPPGTGKISIAEEAGRWLRTYYKPWQDDSLVLYADDLLKHNIESAVTYLRKS